MAIRGVRQTIREAIDETSLEAFEDACEAADKLYRIMEKQTDPKKAHSMAVGWCTSIITLARLEASLLSSVLPLYEEELEPSTEKIDALNQRKADAEAGVYEMRGAQGAVMPLSMRRDPARAKQIHEAKMARADVYTEVRVEMAKLREEREPIRLTIGKINRTLRALRLYIETAFPLPLLPSRNPMSPARADPRADPITAFASRYVDDMDNRGKVDAELQAKRALRAHPLNRYDRTGKVISH